MQLLKDGNNYSIISNATITSEFPKGDYKVREAAFGRIFFEKVSNTIMPDKVFSNDTAFIEHVVTTWKNSEGNVGVGLVGGKGLGKSFTGNMIANQSDAPVFRITEHIGTSNLFDTLEKIEQDYVLFIDEFEKVFDKEGKGDGLSQEDFLTFLDNGSKRKNKVLFIITANEVFKINDFLKNRPSRLKYFKEYKGLQDNIIREVISELLTDQTHKEDLIENLPYEELNIDVLIQIINEINAHNKPYSQFKEFFNFKAKDWKSVNVYAQIDDEWVLIREKISGDISSYSHIGRLPNKKYVINYEYIDLSSDREEYEGYYMQPDPEDEDEDKEVKVNIKIERVKNRLDENAFDF